MSAQRTERSTFSMREKSLSIVGPRTPAVSEFSVAESLSPVSVVILGPGGVRCD